MERKYAVYIIVCLCVTPEVISGSALFAQTSSEQFAAEGEAAQEMMYDEGMAAVETEGYVYGQVISVNGVAHTLTVRETQYTEEIYAFFINRNTNFVNARSLADIGVGDYVTVDYAYLREKYIADQILVDERAREEETPSAAGKVDKVLVD